VPLKKIWLIIVLTPGVVIETLSLILKKMNKLTLVILMTALLLSCKKEQRSDYVIFSGKVENATSDSLILQNSFRKSVHVLKLSNGHTFRDTLKLSPKGFYYLNDGQNNRQLYLKPGFETHILLDSKNDHLVFTGDGAYENNYLVQKELLSDSLKKFNDYHYYGKLEENDYLSLSDSIHTIKVNLFNKYANAFASDFLFLEKNTLKYQNLRNQALYENTKRMVTGNKDFKVSPEYYPTLFKGINLSDEELVSILDYVYFVESYIWQLTQKQLENDDSTDFYLPYLTNVETAIKNDQLKEKLAFHVGIYKLGRTSELDAVYTKVKDLVASPDDLKVIESKYQRFKKVQKGAVSPSFKLENLDGELVSLEDLKGSYVYIDIWSPYCLPCMAEIPYLKEMEKYFHDKNIHFVSICVGETKAGWQKLIKDKSLTGIQLIALNEKISFFRDYQVRGIPRFILIDKAGKIIESSAKRPSNPKLKEELNKILKS